MRVGSVCSGIGAPEAAWAPLGWEFAFAAEIDPFPSAVLAHRFPEVPNLGDFTRIGASAGPVDVLVGGTPCQSFSVAGLRGGMADDRGNLALQFLELSGRLRPRWVVWENVPGVLSSNGGRDFGSFLGGLVELGYGFAYRVLDAQHFALPQRRRRVFVVGHSGDWRRAAAVLFERHSLSGHPAPRREAGAVVAGSLTGSLGRRRGQPDGGDTDGHLIASGSGWGGGVARPLTSHPGGSRLDLDTETFVACTLPASTGGVSSGYHPVVPCTPFVVNAAESCAKQSHARPSEVARRVDSNGSFANAQGGTVVMQPVAFGCKRGGEDVGHDLAPTLDGGGGGGYGKGMAVAWGLKQGNPGANGIGVGEELSHTLQSQRVQAVAHVEPFVFANTAGDTALGLSRPGVPPLTRRNGDPGSVCVPGSAVRRLTPRECERLQGFPDDWTLVPYRGKPAADGPRYKAIGNSMAVPVMAWIGRRIELVESLA